MILNYLNYQQHKTELEKLGVMLQVFIVALLISLFIYLINPEHILYYIILVICIIAFGLTCHGYFQMISLGGEKRPRYEKIVFMGYVLIASIFAMVYYLINVKEQLGGPYLGLDFLTLLPAALVFLGPVLYLGIITIKNFLQIYEQHLRYPMLAFLATLLYYLLALFGVIILTEIRQFSFISLFGAIGMSIYLNRKYPELLVQIGSSFAYKSLYILRNNGQTIYTYEFEASDELKDDNMIRYLIGGFLYAISHGIKEIIKEEYNTILRTMDFGKLKMQFYYGKKVFGLLFTREANNQIYNKLNNFIDEFEELFEDFIEDTMSVNLLEEQSLSEKDKTNILQMEELVKKHFKTFETN